MTPSTLSDPVKTIERYLNRIHQYNPALNAFIEVRADKNTIQTSLRGKEKGKLYGVPIAIKDNICVEGWEITCASKILKNFVSPYNATVVERLLNEGAFLLGRTNMDEFAFGSSCETSVYGPTRNPWDVERAPGGSSGGSASAVAADLARMALGSDTGGSIRQPAAFCGIVGLKPTYGRVSRYGLVAFGSSLDQIGPMTRNVEDAALLLEVIAGFDPKDSTSSQEAVRPYSQLLGQSLKGYRVGIPNEFFSHDLDSQVKSKIDQAIRVFEKEGAQILPVSLPHTPYAVAVYYVVGPCEASSNLSRFDGVKYGYRASSHEGLIDMYMKTRAEGFGKEAKRRILLGTYALSSGYYDAYYLKAMKARRKIIDDFKNAFEKVDVLLTPTAPSEAFKIGEKADDPLQMYLSDIFTISANLSGSPAISVPCGFSERNLPIGLQLTGKPYGEEALLNAAYIYQERSGYKNCLPKGFEG